MLKKLYKHEFYSLFRNMLPIYAALIGFALLSRLTYLFEVNNTAVNLLKGFSTTIYIFSIIAMFIIGMVVVVTRFYKNLLSHEGYLTFTLPFTATQHIVCKLICGAVVIAINTILVICSLLILGAGTDVLAGIFKVIGEAFHMANETYSTGRIIGMIAEITVMMIFTLFQGLLMFYASIAIGQQFKNKVGGAVISYICLYAAVEIITTIVMIPTVLTNADNFENFMNSGINAVQTFFAFPIILSAVLGTAYFFITRYFLSKKLNLE